MSIKSFVNSRNGRLGLVVTGMALVAVFIAGGILWWLFYLPTLSLSVVDQETIEAEASNFARVEVVQEDSPLVGLPSSTLAVRDSQRELMPSSIFRFAQNAVSRSEKESLVNSHLFREPEEGYDGMSYDFMFYSSSLSDYAVGEDFEAAEQQFQALANFGANSLEYSSMPISSGGRELTIDLTASVSFSSSSSAAFEAAWDRLLNDLRESVDFGDGVRIDLTLRDSSGTITLKTLLNDDESLESSFITESLWKTFDSYLRSSYYSFLDARRVTYSIERTSQDSVLTIHSGDQVVNTDTISDRMWRAAQDSDDPILFPGSYITYVVTPESSEPVVFFPSSSRNW